MTLEVKAEGGYWSLYVNGRRALAEESYTVVSTVRDLLAEGRVGGIYGECGEVAEAILSAKGPV